MILIKDIIYTIIGIVILIVGIIHLRDLLHNIKREDVSTLIRYIINDKNGGKK